jgi:hypothetical protein
MPIGAIAIGSRAKNAAAEKPFAPGALKISEYGLPMTISLLERGADLHTLGMRIGMSIRDVCQLAYGMYERQESENA